MLICRRYKFKYIIFSPGKGWSSSRNIFIKSLRFCISVVNTAETNQSNVLYPAAVKGNFFLSHIPFIFFTKIRFSNNLVSFLNTRFWENRKCHFLMLFEFLEKKSSLEICCFSFSVWEQVANPDFSVVQVPITTTDLLHLCDPLYH